MAYEFERKQRIAVLGGGPGGYEAALAGAQLGADVTLVEREGVGGSAVRRPTHAGGLARTCEMCAVTSYRTRLWLGTTARDTRDNTSECERS